MHKVFGFLIMLFGTVLLTVCTLLFLGFLAFEGISGLILFPLIAGILSVFIIKAGYRMYYGKPAEEGPFVNPYVDYTLYEKGELPPVNYPSLGLSPGEVIYFATPANTFVQKEQVVGYSGGSSGFNIRIAKGVTYRTGGSKGAPIRDNVIKYNPGDFIVTNQRVVFIGIKDSFDIPAEKLTAARVVATDAFIILAGNKQKNLQMDTSQAVYALGFTRQLISGGILKAENDDEPQMLE